VADYRWQLSIHRRVLERTATLLLDMLTLYALDEAVRAGIWRQWLECVDCLDYFADDGNVTSIDKAA
jgi:hypothetical protein